MQSQEGRKRSSTLKAESGPERSCSANLVLAKAVVETQGDAEQRLLGLPIAGDIPYTAIAHS